MSPVLFNLALEPFLHSILGDSAFVEVQPKCVDSFSLVPRPTLLKVLAYADDVFVFLNSSQDLTRLQMHMDRYQAASNTRFNAHKTQAISLSGRPLPHWTTVLEQAGFPRCHDQTWSEPLTYLGFPLFSSSPQLQVFLGRLLHSIQSACQLHSQRQLSIRDRATVLNSLILSRLWHVLRLVGAAPSTFFRQLRSVCGQFLMTRMFPLISFERLCQPRHRGGVRVPGSIARTIRSSVTMAGTDFSSLSSFILRYCLPVSSSPLHL